MDEGFGWGYSLKLAIATRLERRAVKNLFLVVYARLEVHISVKKWREAQTVSIPFFCDF